MLREIVAAVDGAGLRPQKTAWSEIWTYERAGGRRLVMPFEVDGLPGGSVQMDVVFNEELPIPPEPIVLTGVDEPVLAATDMYPQGKDLYDAVLLAEYTTVNTTVIPELNDFTPDTVLEWGDVDGDNFAAEYPGVDGDADAWVQRLARALTRRT